MQPPKNKWSTTTGARGVLFFAQQMREMLSPTTFESFRAFSLDTQTRLIESRMVIRDVQRKRIPAASADSFIEELRWSLDVDPVLATIAPDERHIALIKLKDKQSKPADLITIIDLLLDTVRGKYISSLENAIISIFEDQNQRSRLRILTGFYCSALLNTGYSRHHLTDRISDHFFSKDMMRVGTRTFRSFFRELDQNRKQYLIYIPTNSKMAKASGRIFSPPMNLAALPSHVATAYASSPKPSAQLWIRLETQSQDEYAAANFSERILLSVLAMNHLGSEIRDLSWDPERFVSRSRSNSGKFCKPSMTLDSPRGLQGAGRINSLARTVRAITDALDQASGTRLINALNFSAIHLTNTPIESQLVSLWSSVEILLSEPPEGTARIVHYVEKLVPCIAYRYVRRSLAAICDDFQTSYRQRFVRILKKERTFLGGNLHDQFGAILMMEENDSLRNELLAMCSDNPLALHRLYKAWSDFRNPGRLEDALLAHEKRLRWHIYRIYRVRNQLVHTGTLVPYLESISRNLFEYFKSAVWSILNYARRNDREASLSRIVDRIGVEFEMHKNYLREISKQPAFDAISVNRAISLERSL